MFTALSGLIAGLLGVGGGAIMNPLLLNLGYRPEVSTASSSFVVLFTAFVSTIQYIINNSIDFYYGVWLFVTSICGSAIGTFLILRAIAKFKRVSIIVLMLAAVMIISLIGIPLFGILEIIRKINQGKFKYGFGSFC